jgi:hypothetical protein
MNRFTIPEMVMLVVTIATFAWWGNIEYNIAICHNFLDTLQFVVMRINAMEYSVISLVVLYLSTKVRLT